MLAETNSIIVVDMARVIVVDMVRVIVVDMARVIVVDRARVIVVARVIVEARVIVVDRASRGMGEVTSHFIPGKHLYLVILLNKVMVEDMVYLRQLQVVLTRVFRK